MHAELIAKLDQFTAQREQHFERRPTWSAAQVHGHGPHTAWLNLHTTAPLVLVESMLDHESFPAQRDFAGYDRQIDQLPLLTSA